MWKANASANRAAESGDTPAQGESARKSTPKKLSVTSNELNVTADDGVELHVEIQDRPDATLTIIFCHGAMLNLDSWHFQRDAFGEHARLVLWDQRGHGRSGWGTPPNATIDQL